MLDPIHDPDRLAALRRLGLLDAPQDAGFDRMTRLGATLLEVPAAFVSLVDEDRDFHLSRFGSGGWPAGRQISGPTFCHHTIRSAAPLVIPDTRANPVYRTFPTVESMSVAAYLGIPLITPGGHAVGTLCAVDTRPRSWTEREIGVLTDLAAGLLTEFELRAARSDRERVTKALQETTAAFEEQAIEMKDQVVEYRALAAELEATCERLQQSRSTFGLLAGGIRDYAILMLSPGGHIRSWNEGAHRIKGYSAEEALGEHVSLLYPPEARASGEVEAMLARALREGRAETEGWRIRKDGTRFWANTVVTAVRDGRGVLQGFAKVTRDLSERRAMEAALRHQNEQLAEAQRIAGVGSWDWDVGAGIIEWSAEMHRLWGRTPEAGFVAFADFFGGVHPEDREHTQAALDAALQSGRPFDCEYRVLRPDGTLRDIRARGELLRDPEGGTPVRMIGTAQDVSEQKRAEQALKQSEHWVRTMFEHAADGISVHDLSGHLLDVNERLCTTLGYTREEMLGLTVADLDANYVSGKFEQIWRDTTPGAAATINGLLRHSDGSLIPMEVRVARLELGNRPLILALLRDVTEQTVLEQQLRQSQKMEAVGQLAGGVAHDFNNMLTAIKGFTSLLQMDTEPASEEGSYLAEIQKAADHSAALTRQLLAFSRKQVLQPRLVALDEIVVGVQGMLRRLIGADVELRTELADEVSLTLADPGQMEQVIMNLAVNARDAMRQGGRLLLKTGTRTLAHPERQADNFEVPAGGYSVLSVSDSGCGMDEQTLTRIFEPFFTTKAVGAGTGLGLSTVYGIVKQSGGYVWAESAPGEGTTMHVYLPRAEPEQRGAEGAERRATSGAGAGTVLLVEDEPTVRLLARLTLEKAGYSVLQAADGSEALRQLATATRVDLLLTDVVMPGMSGQELVERIRERRPDIRILFMSGYADEAVQRHGVVAENSEFIPKPFRPEALLQKVGEVLRRGPAGIPLTA